MAKDKYQSRGKLSICLMVAVAVLVGFLCARVEAQFFTKSSSKSIPRMGRRSDSSMEPNRMIMSSYSRHTIMDKLLDEYGPNLVNILEAMKAPASNYRYSYDAADRPESPSVNSEPLADGSGENLSGLTFDIQSAEGPSYRMERSSAPATHKTSDSLAMRALYLDRLLHHLSSGQPPMGSERIMSPKGQANGFNGHYKEEKRQSTDTD